MSSVSAAQLVYPWQWSRPNVPQSLANAGDSGQTAVSASNSPATPAQNSPSQAAYRGQYVDTSA